MGVVTLRLPDDTHQRIKALAASRNMSVKISFLKNCLLWH